MYARHHRLGVVEFGAMRSSERALVLDGWVEGVVDAMGHGRHSHSRHRHAHLVATRNEVDAYLQDGALVLVARDAECAARAFGWIAGVSPTLLWCSVKRDFRREGVARLLFAALTRELGQLHHFASHSRHDALAERAGLTFRQLTEVA